MKKIDYPVLCYTLNEHSVLGMLVGGDDPVEVVEKDANTILNIIKSHLQRQYKKYDDYPFSELTGTRLKVMEVKHRPVYRTNNGAFPIAQELKVPYPIVYGETPYGAFECHIPLSGHSFYYQDKKQLNTLARYAIQNHLASLKPEAVYKLIQLPVPELHFVQMKVNENRQINWKALDIQSPPKTLQRLAELYPPPKVKLKSTSLLPETAWERDETVQEAMDKMINSNANVLLVGASGIGKSAVIRTVIRKVLSRSKKHKSSRTFWRILAQRITATSKYLGEWQMAVEKLIQELDGQYGMLWVENLVQLMQVGGREIENSVAAYLVTFLREGKVQIVGEATQKEFEVLQRKLPEFVESFHVIEIEELQEASVFKVLRQYSEFIFQSQKIRISEKQLNLAYRLLNRYFPYEQFPGKGINFLGRCVSEVKMKKLTEVRTNDVIENFRKQSGLPELFLKDEMLLDEKGMNAFFEGRIMGQKAVIDQLSEVVKIFKAGLNNPLKPISILFFAGPTGVGKTASAKALADYFFGQGQSKNPLIRIDMSEFQHPWQLGRLLGEGDSVGILTKAVRAQPFAVVLLDEIEKASPVVFDALLGILDEGIIVDSFGRITNFRNTIIILTSNLGASSGKAPGFNSKATGNNQYHSAITRFFRPEFVNRIDNIVVFEYLENVTIREICIKELETIKKREGFQKRKLNLNFSDNLIEYLVKKGYDRKYGARPLQRALEDELIQPLANWLLKNPKENAKSILVDYDQNKGIGIFPQ